MATYSAVTAGEKDADSPINVSLIDKLDQNPHAIAEGASGAPKIQTAAIQDDAVTNAKLEKAYYSGRVDSDGTTGSSNLPSGWTVSKSTVPFTHQYTITHGLSNSNFTFVGTCEGSTRKVTLNSKTTSDVTVTTTDSSNNAQAAATFDFIIIVN